MSIAEAIGSQSTPMLFGEAAIMVYAIVAAACSSPQTAEINAKKRSGTLMKWVYLGLGQAGFFVALMAIMAYKEGGVGSMMAAVLGGALAAAILYASYWHAKRAGMANSAPGTEG
jgi:O-antigen/teichoic acid export membrane protein